MPNQAGIIKSVGWMVGRFVWEVFDPFLSAFQPGRMLCFFGQSFGFFFFVFFPFFFHLFSLDAVGFDVVGNGSVDFS